MNIFKKILRIISISSVILLLLFSSFVYAATSNGKIDTSFNAGGSGFDGTLGTQDIEVQPDGKIIVSGRQFTTYNSVDIPDRLVRLNADGSIDSTFNSGGSGFLNGEIWDSAIQSDGKIVAVGYFTYFNGYDAAHAVQANIIRLNADGSRDTTFNSGGSGLISASASQKVEIQPDGKILVSTGGSIYNGVTVSGGLIRLNSDGTLDTSFNVGGSGFTGYPFEIRLLNSGKIMVGGQFYQYNGVGVSQGLVRLNSDGSLDTSFNASGSGVVSSVYDIEELSNGKMLISGVMQTYNGVTVPKNLFRINSDGSLDTSFNAGGVGFEGDVSYDTEVQSDGKIIVSGMFTKYNGVDTPDGIIRLNSDGSLDTSFNSSGLGISPGEVIYDIEILSTGHVLIAGSFTNYNASSVSNHIERLQIEITYCPSPGNTTQELLLDGDCDGDGISNTVEGYDPNGDGNPNDALDKDDDGTPNYLDTDSDGDKLLDKDETTKDDDGDGIPNYLDPFVEGSNIKSTLPVTGTEIVEYFSFGLCIGLLGLAFLIERKNISNL